MSCLVTQLCLTLCKLMDCRLPGSSVHGDSPGKNTGVGCHALLQGIFPTQKLNPGLLHCRHILYQPSYEGSLSNPSWFSLIGETSCTRQVPGAKTRHPAQTLPSTGWSLCLQMPGESRIISLLQPGLFQKIPTVP